jgi:hypothetical protein
LTTCDFMINRPVIETVLDSDLWILDGIWRWGYIVMIDAMKG